MRKSVALASVLALMTFPVAAEEFKLVTGNEYAPYTDQTLPEGGLATEIVKAAFAASGHTLKIDFLPWKRGYDLALAGDYDATFPYVTTEERQKGFVYSVPMVTLSQVLLSNPAAGISSADAAALKGKRICLPLGYSTIKPVQALVDAKEITRSELPDMKACMQHVANGRSDFLIIDKMSGTVAMKTAGIDEKTLNRVTLDSTTNTLHLMVGRNHKDGAKIVAAFNDGFEKLKSSGDLRKIIEKHIPGYTE
jgi:polar amino acid transport system substrate-binding protein